MQFFKQFREKMYTPECDWHRENVGENARAASQIKSGPHPELQPAPDKDYRNAYALAFTVFQISVYLSSRASDV